MRNGIVGDLRDYLDRLESRACDAAVASETASVAVTLAAFDWFSESARIVASLAASQVSDAEASPRRDLAWATQAESLLRDADAFTAEMVAAAVRWRDRLNEDAAWRSVASLPRKRRARIGVKAPRQAKRRGAR